jgi:hypothetical protein
MFKILKSWIWKREWSGVGELSRVSQRTWAVQEVWSLFRSCVGPGYYWGEAIATMVIYHHAVNSVTIWNVQHHGCLQRHRVRPPQGDHNCPPRYLIRLRWRHPRRHPSDGHCLQTGCRQGSLCNLHWKPAYSSRRCLVGSLLVLHCRARAPAWQNQHLALSPRPSRHHLLKSVLKSGPKSLVERRAAHTTQTTHVW